MSVTSIYFVKCTITRHISNGLISLHFNQQDKDIVRMKWQLLQQWYCKLRVLYWRVHSSYVTSLMHHLSLSTHIVVGDSSFPLSLPQSLLLGSRLLFVSWHKYCIARVGHIALHPKRYIILCLLLPSQNKSSLSALKVFKLINFLGGNKSRTALCFCSNCWTFVILWPP